MFPEFRDISLTDLEQRQRLRGHTERVMRTIENSVNAVDDPDSLNEYLVELGRRHVMRSVKPSVGDVSIVIIVSAVNKWMSYSDSACGVGRNPGVKKKTLR